MVKRRTDVTPSRSYGMTSIGRTIGDGGLSAGSYSSGMIIVAEMIAVVTGTVAVIGLVTIAGVMVGSTGTGCSRSSSGLGSLGT